MNFHQDQQLIGTNFIGKTKAPPIYRHIFFQYQEGHLYVIASNKQYLGPERTSKIYLIQVIMRRLCQ